MSEVCKVRSKSPRTILEICREQMTVKLCYLATITKGVLEKKGAAFDENNPLTAVRPVGGSILFVDFLAASGT